MQLVMNSYRGLSVLVWLNADRVFVVCAVLAALGAGAFLSAELVPLRH